MVKKLKIILFSEKFVKFGIKKLEIYERNLNKKFFDIFLVFNNTENKKIIEHNNRTFIIPEEKLKSFIKKNDIDLFCSFSSNKRVLLKLKDDCVCFNSVNFTDLYISDKKITNLIISKTDHLKIQDLHKKNLTNANVLYNPLDVNKWKKFLKKKEYHNFFNKKNIKFIVGRLGRAEPTKWNFLIIASLFKLDKQKNYDYGFIFAGMPKLYIWTLKLILSKKFKKNVLLLGQLRGYKEVSTFYNSIDLFWQTSYVGESFGNVIAESFCYKVPVMTDFKDFYRKDGSVNPKWYNAQMELVDHNVNGFYVNYPSKVIETLNSLNKSRLNKLGGNGLYKAKNTYDIKLSIKTMEKFFMKKAYENNCITKIPYEYERIKFLPKLDEVKNFKREYLRILKLAKKVNNISGFERRMYNLSFNIWHLIEIFYLSTRYILKKYLKRELDSK